MRICHLGTQALGRGQSCPGLDEYKSSNRAARPPKPWRMRARAWLAPLRHNALEPAASNPNLTWNFPNWDTGT